MGVFQIILLLATAAAASARLEYSTSPPGGLTPDQIPQFVLFTHDDAVNSESYAAVRSIADGRVINGCAVVATMFAKVEGLDCDIMRELYDSGYEIADHSVNHDSLLDMDTEEVSYEIVGARQQLSECGIPEGDIVGVRTPFLHTNPEVRRIIADAGFTYDSTQRIYGDPSSRVWPFDLADGIPEDDCTSTQSCDSDESYPGLIEVPVWFLSAQGESYHMNYGEDGAVDVYSFLKDAFDSTYYGNRAPMPLFVHTPWIEEFDTGMRKFVDYAASLPDVYFVTVRQLLAWMQNPVPKDQITPEILGCGNQGGAGPSEPFRPAPPAAPSSAPAPAPGPAADMDAAAGPAPGPAPSFAPGPAPESAGGPAEQSGAR